MDLETFVRHLKNTLEDCEKFEPDPDQPFEGQMDQVGPTGNYQSGVFKGFRVYLKDGSQFHLEIRKFE